MKTFKTRSSVMNRVVVESMNNYGSYTVSVISPPSPPSLPSSSYILFLDKINYDCIEDRLGYGTGTYCRYTSSAAYFSYLSQNIDILFNKSAFTSDDLDKFGNYNNIIAIFMLDKLYTVEYKEIISNMYIKYTINEPKDTVLENLDRIRETNKQVVVDKNNTNNGDRGFYQIFTEKGKVRVLG
jgi:hypothetical protein